MVIGELPNPLQWSISNINRWKRSNKDSFERTMRLWIVFEDYLTEQCFPAISVGLRDFCCSIASSNA
jgi:hypothetical protein